MKNKNQSHYKLNHLAIWLLITNLLFSFSAQAQTAAAGTLIKNQAIATYKDAQGLDHVTTSNLVETLIQKVGAMDLTEPQTRPSIAGSTVYFPHVLTNTGNDVDTFTLSSTTNDSGDDYDFTSVTLYADANRDGLPDDTTPITSSGKLAANEEFFFVAAAAVPSSGVSANDAGKTTITAVSAFDGLVSKTNQDTVTITDKAVVEVTKSMSASSGYSPSDTFTVTLKYANNGSQTATNVTLLDALPTGMSYVAGSARWSETGAAVLTDADKSDDQSGMIYCAYHNDCTSLPSNGDSKEQVTAIIASVATGQSGYITFDAQIESGVAAATLHNTAEYEYNDSSTVVTRVPSNKVPYEVLALPVVVANGSDDDTDPDNADNTGGTTDAFIVATANQGETVSFDNIIRNKGNSEDTFDISINSGITNPFPTNTVFMLYQEDGFTPLMDTNNNGTVDTGLVAAGGKYKVVLKAYLPINATTGNNGGAGFNVSKTATSSIDNTVSDSVTDTLQAIVGASVDLTNNAAIGGAGVAGAGAGPETNPVTTKTVAPGGQAVFTLFVNNTSDVNSSFSLQYSKDNPFIASTVKTGWKVNFYEDGGNNDCSTQGRVISETGVIAAQSNKLVCAVVTVPAGAIAEKDSSGDPIAYSVYFRAISAVTGINDIKHDAVIISDAAALSITPDQIGQVIPGGTVNYPHNITNTGNTPLECINLTSTNTQNGWTSVIYKDVNADGKLDSGDVVLTDQTLNPGESFPILVKLFAPATTPMGTKNTTTLELTGNQDDGDGNAATCNGAVVNDAVKDLTTVNQSEVSITKEQSADNDCNGSSDTGVFATTTFQINPESCVIYRLTALNAGSSPVNNVRIDDAAPTFTTFIGSPVVTQGNISGGIAGQDGVISAGSVGGASITLQSGQTMELIFSVKLD